MTAAAVLRVVMAEIAETSEGMIEDGHCLDPLGCDVPPEDIVMIYSRIWSAMHACLCAELGLTEPERSGEGE